MPNLNSDLLILFEDDIKACNFSSEEKVIDVGPIEDTKDSIRVEPYTLPPLFVWDEVDLNDEDQVHALLPRLFMKP